MDYWQYCRQIASIGGGALSWGHTVQRFGSNPDLGNAVQCISLSGTE